MRERKRDREKTIELCLVLNVDIKIIMRACLRRSSWAEFKRIASHINVLLASVSATAVGVETNESA